MCHTKGAVDKRRPQSESLSSADILRTRVEGVLQMRTFALFGENVGFFEIYRVSARTPVRTFCGQGGIYFAICADVLYGRPLSIIVTYYKTETK